MTTSPIIVSVPVAGPYVPALLYVVAFAACAITATPPAPTVPSTGTGDTTAPILSNVTTGQITIGDDVHGTSDESGYLYLVPSTTAKTIADLNQAITASLGKKSSVTAAVDLTISTAGLTAGSYVVYAVDSSNNISTASAEILINKKQLTIQPGTLTAVKMYDGTTAAAVTVGSLIGVVSGDAVTVRASAAYNSAATGTDKTITVTYTLSGANAANYIAPASYTVNTGEITITQLTISNPLLTLDKIRDGKITAAVIAGNLVGVAPDEAVTVSAVANYDTADLGTNKTITVTYTIAGAHAANYIAPVNYIVNNGEISIDLITKSKVYDGTTSAASIVGPRNGVIEGDDVKINALATYNDKKVGINKEITVDLFLTGDDAGNYEIFGYKVIGVITALQLTIDTPVLTASKVFDGTTAATVTAGSLIGVIEGDDVTVHAVATYNNAAVGTNKTITIVYTLTGADAANYVAPANYTINSFTKICHELIPVLNRDQLFQFSQTGTRPHTKRQQNEG